jgi:hypothetical protein
MATTKHYILDELLTIDEAIKLVEHRVDLNHARRV